LTLEETVIQTVESGYMTKDLAILVHKVTKPDRSTYLNTFEFIDKVAVNLDIKLGRASGKIQDSRNIGKLSKVMDHLIAVDSTLRPEN